MLSKNKHNAIPTPASLKYPEPGKYTIAGNKMAESSLASIAEHPTVVNAVECALGQPAHLTAFVAYLRSPGDRGSGGPLRLQALAPGRLIHELGVRYHPADRLR